MCVLLLGKFVPLNTRDKLVRMAIKEKKKQQEIPYFGDNK